MRQFQKCSWKLCVCLLSIYIITLAILKRFFFRVAKNSYWDFFSCSNKRRENCKMSSWREITAHKKNLHKFYLNFFFYSSKCENIFTRTKKLWNQKSTLFARSHLHSQRGLFLLSSTTVRGHENKKMN